MWEGSQAEKLGLRTGFKLLEYGTHKLEKLTAEQICDILGMNFIQGQKKEKNTLYIKFLDDDEIIIELELPMVDIRSFKSNTK